MGFCCYCCFYILGYQRGQTNLLFFCLSSFLLFFFFWVWGLEREAKGREGIKDGCLWQASTVSDQAWRLLPRSPIPQSASSIALDSGTQLLKAAHPTGGVPSWAHRAPLSQGQVSHKQRLVPSAKHVTWELTRSTSCGEARKPVVSRIGFYF